MAGSNARIVWHGKRVTKDIEQEMTQRLSLVGEMLASTARRNLSTPGPKHSVPGEFPHAITGNLRKSVTYEAIPAESLVRFGTNAVYAHRLETELQRSFILRTVVPR